MRRAGNDKDTQSFRCRPSRASAGSGYDHYDFAAYAGLLGVLAETGSNVVSIKHGGTGADLGVAEVQIRVEVETEGHEHCREVLDALRAEDYGVLFHSVA